MNSANYKLIKTKLKGPEKPIIFVGSSVSRYTSDENEASIWSGLLKNGLERCVKQGFQSNDNIKNFIEKFKKREATTTDYLNAADLISNSLKSKEGEYQQWILDAIGGLTPIKKDLIKSIGALKCPIFTTNYDPLLEQVLNKKTHDWDSISKEGIDNLNDYILHVHGYFKKSDSVILTQSDYDRILKNKTAQGILKAFFTVKPLIFIGFGSGLDDPNFKQLLDWRREIWKKEENNEKIKAPPIFKFERKVVQEGTSIFDENDVKKVTFKDEADLIVMLNGLSGKEVDLQVLKNKAKIESKYLQKIIKDYSHISLLGFNSKDFALQMDKVFISLKFDPTHPSIREIKYLEIEEAFKNGFIDADMFTTDEKNNIQKAFKKKYKFYPEKADEVSKKFLMDQWVDVFLDDNESFSHEDRVSIKTKVKKLKEKVAVETKLPESASLDIDKVYENNKHFIVLGDPGSGKTTLAKWIAIGMAQKFLKEGNNNEKIINKFPIFVTMTKYISEVHEKKDKKLTILQYISEKIAADLENSEERQIISEILKDHLVDGEALIILEGLDEVPEKIDRVNLIKEIDDLIDRQIYVDKNSELSFSSEDNSKERDEGNRVIVTSRIEGNYSDDIKITIPRLTIEKMSTHSLSLFCSNYSEAIKDKIKNPLKLRDQDNQLFESIRKNDVLLELAVNPQLASLISCLYFQYEGELPDKRADLYEKAIQIMIERLKLTFEKMPKIKLKLEIDELWLVMQEIAFYLHSRSDGLTEQKLVEILMNNTLKKNITATNEDSQILVNCLKVQSGLLSEFGQNNFKFLHRTFQEFLVSKYLICEKNGDEIFR